MGHTKSKRALLALTIALALGLAACGGGGGGGGAPKNSESDNNSGGYSVPPPASASTVAIVTAPPAIPAAYTVEEVAAFNRFNEHRANCGFGYLEGNTNLETAATNHITWMVNNNTVSHDESMGTPGYTGYNPTSRMIAAGYANGNSFGEVLTGGINVPLTGSGLAGARRLLAAPYHLQALMQGFRDIGISARSGGPTGSGANITYPGAYNVSWLVADLAASTNKLSQAQDANDVLTYPCQGTTDVDYEVRAESPNPVPSRDLSTQPIGHPIFIQSKAGRTLTISSVTLTGNLGSVSLLPTMTRSNDPNRYLLANQAFVIPSASLSANTSYTAVIVGTHEGTAFNKTFAFTTRP